MLAHICRSEACVWASTIGGEGSAPRKTKAHMLVSAKGRVCGTVGGGSVEGKSIELAVRLLRDQTSCTQRFELFAGSEQGLDMICGGSVNVHFRYIAPGDTAMRKLAEEAVCSFERGIKTWLMIDTAAHRIGIYGEGFEAGDVFLPEEIGQMKNCPASEGENRYYREMLVRPGRVYIFGGGHVAQALVPVLASVDFRCVVLEDREEFCRRDLFLQAEDVKLIQESEWKTLPEMGPEDCICIMTRNHRNDLACQAFAMTTKAGYIGVIGSRRKIAAVNARLRDMGFCDEDIARIITPIGLDIGAQTPAEIAVSIAAQMIAHRAAAESR